MRRRRFGKRSFRRGRSSRNSRRRRRLANYRVSRGGIRM